MANALFDSVSASEKIYLGKMQTSQNIRIATKDNISSILSVGVDSWISSSECIEGEAAFSGRTNIRLLYCDEGGIPYGLNYNADYNDRFVSKHINPSTRILFEVTVVDHKTEQMGNVVNARVLLEITAYAFVNNSVVAMVGGEDMFVKNCDCNLSENYGVTYFNAQMDCEITADNPVSGVLLSESRVSVSKMQVNDGIVTVNGRLHSTVVYTSDDKVCSQCQSMDFVREFPLQGDVYEVYGYADVRGTKVRLELEDDQQQATFDVQSNVCFTVVYCARTTTTLVCDCYTRDSQLQLKKTSVTTTLPVGNVCLSRDIRQSFPMDVKGQKVAVCSDAVVTRCVSDGGVTVEGVLNISLLYLDGETLGNTMLEVPFSQQVQMDGADADCMCWARVTPSNVDVDINSQTVSATLEMCVSCWKSCNCTVISAVDEKPCTDKPSAIEIFYARKGQSMWDLAKSLKLAEEEVRASNPELGDVIQDDIRIAVYHKL